MPKRDHFPAVFAALRDQLQPLSTHLIVTTDKPDCYYLDAPPSAMYPQGVFFGAARMGKTYVSYHLMPVYMFPDLRDRMPERLRKRMQGKSCFNFTSIDEETISDLARFTEAAFRRCQVARLVPAP
jgi:hypothetical protein